MSKSDIEPQEIFLDALAKKKEEELGISEIKLEIPLSQKILKGALILIVLLFLVLFIRTFIFQVKEYEKFFVLAQGNQFIFHSINANRGVIYDSNGKQLVFNKPSFDLVLNKDKLPEDETEKERVLSEVKEITKDNWHNLDHQTLIWLEAKIDQFSGFEIEYNSIRYYQEGPSFAHIIGYMGREEEDYVGKEGLEKSYQEVLNKNPGKIKIERDVYGNLLSKEIVSLPQSGKSLVLWLDSDLQKKIEQTLNKIIENTGSKKAVAVALDPRTGGVLSLVSIPGYDNNLFNKEADQNALKELLTNPQEPLFNRALSGLYSTGSTIKPLIAAAALEEEIISPLEKIICQGEITTPHRYDPEIIYHHKDWRIHGPTDIRKAIAESCNVYFYTIGGELGPSTIKKYLELFNWGALTGIDIPGEAQGLIPFPEWKKEVKKENWWDGDTYNLAIGQGDILVTPLQVAVAFGAVANKGTLYQPKLVKQIVDKDKNIIEELSSRILRKDFISSGNLEIVRQGMRRAVTGQESPYASSVLLNSLPVAAAAKTGTAQTGVKDHYHNWVAVFAPYENPEIVLTIMFENVKEGMAVALPAAKEILEWYFGK